VISQIEISVIIPTRNRSDLLTEQIESLFKQTLSPERYEIIVLDNLSDDDTPEKMKELIAKAPCKMRFHPLGENRGPVHARNLGAQMAEGSVLAFTDSDCVTHPEWLARGLAAMQTTPKTVMVSGAVLNKPGQQIKFFSLTNCAPPGENYTYPGCNVFYRKDLFLAMGGFDQSAWLYDIGHSPIECADSDLAWKVREAGHHNAYSDDVIVYHEVKEVSLMSWLMYPARLLVLPELIRRHPQLRDQLLLGGLFFSRENIIFYVFLAGLILAPFLGVWWLLLSAPYVLWALSTHARFSLGRIHRLLARIPLFAARHAVMCGSLVYGSLRSRTLVL
jgi:glycosyltransferase involved in cell wall biosynthesis